MGNPMDGNIHAPTVPSGPTTGGTTFRDRSKSSMVELMNEKEIIEAELSTLGSVLSSHNVDMNTSLTTFDGFPRNDIDVPQIRTTRARIIHLRNDHKEVMKHLEKGLHAHFAALQQGQNVSLSINMPSQSTIHSTLPTRDAPRQTGDVGMPFARVNNVINGSPADQAGLKAGDNIRSFGIVNWVNHERLSKIAEIVQQNEGRPLAVKVVRKNDQGGTSDLNLSLTPRRDWGGRGLLGCHLVPL